MPLLTKLYRQNPWQFNINVTTLVCKISPAYNKVSYIVERATEHSNVEVRRKVTNLLKDMDKSSYKWVQNLLYKLRYDSDPIVKATAIKYANYYPVQKKKEPVKQTSLISEKQRTGRDLMNLYEDLKNKRSTHQYMIEEKITDLYSAVTLKKIFTTLLIPLFEELELLDNYRKPIHNVKKKYLTTIFTYVILDDILFKAMLERLPDSTKKLLELLVWEGGSYYIKEIEKTFRDKILYQPRGGFYHEKDLINSNFLLFQIQTNYDYFSGKRQGTIYLEDELRKIFKRHLPMPEAAVLKSLDKIPKKLYSYFDDNQFVYQIDIFNEYIQQGNIQYSKSTFNILKTSLKKWNNYFNIQEFYSEDDSNLTSIFSTIIIDFLNKIAPQNIALKNIDDIKKLILDYFNFNNFKKYNFLRLLSHVRLAYYMNKSVEEEIRKSFLNLLKIMSDYNWLSIDNILTNIKCNIEDQKFSYREEFEHSLYLNIPSVQDYYSYGRNWVTRDMYNDVILIPLVKGMFFLFGALGLVNIAYDFPSNKTYQLRDRMYLTVFDGLKFVKISEFGKYVLGVSNSFDFKKEEKSTKVMLDEKRLIITIEGPGRLERMVLNRLAEQIGDNYYKISYHSFLKDCFSENDIINKISIFKEKISSTLPLVWEEFFKEVEGKINPLEHKENMNVFKIKPSKELVSLVARDEILKKNILKVEDYHIAIKKHNLIKVKKRLKEFGFFIDNI